MPQYGNHMNGHQLQLLRTAMGVRPKDLARAMSCSTSEISRWENSHRVTEKAVNRYLNGLATFGTIPTVTVTTDAA